MTKEEFDKRKQEIEKEKECELKKLRIEYAHSNRKYEIGDIIEDHYHRIKVEKFSVYDRFKEYTEILYDGVELKKTIHQRKDK